ncbi:MAG: NAD(P)/FAD-dependent oxidoreductase [Methanobacterium sp.]
MDEYDVIIVGSGPAGLTAGIYAGRQGLKTLILEKALTGGAGLTVPNMENYPGFEIVTGKQLIEYTKTQALKYAQINELEEVVSIDIKGENDIMVSTPKNQYKAKKLIITTGTTHRKLGAKGEDAFLGRGVFYCAVCDGPLFVGKRIVVVGGGNTAAQGALFLNSIGAYVAIVHRRDELRAEKYLKEKLDKEEIPIIWDTVVEEIKGEMLLNSVTLHNVKDDTKKEYEVSGVYIAIGESPNNEIAKSLGVEVNQAGFIKTDKNQKTNIEGVYAAGDICVGFNQWVIACGEGATAALSVYDDLQK